MFQFIHLMGPLIFAFFKSFRSLGLGVSVKLTVKYFRFRVYL